MDKSWINKPRLSQEYIRGVEGFLDFAFSKSDASMLKCPCCRCSLVKNKYREDMYGDLMYYGFLPTYTNWHFHGERLNIVETSMLVEPREDYTVIEDSTMNLLNDVFPRFDGSFDETASSSNQPMDEDEVTNQPHNSDERRAFDELLADSKEELYEGCTSFSKLSFMLKLYHIKIINKISDKGISMIIDLLREAFKDAKLPSSLNDLKKTIHKLGLDYESIHSCPNDCMLFWGEDKDRDVCKICETSRWKVKSTERVNEEASRKKREKRKQAAKVLRYFPLKPRLQRLFMSSKTAESMKWHATVENKDGKLRHPRDGQAWKTFDQRFPTFGSDSRNVRLGLATDGFNPYGAMSTSYSIWPVLLFPYNLPPWMAMKQSSMILSMIIPGKQMPGNDIDVYLQPLIKELKELWDDGVQTLDASTNQTFCMRAALMWTISDFPGLGNLSGWNIYTGLACPSCNFDAAEFRLQYGKKNCFMGHRRFLQPDHKFRFDRQHFDGKEELRNPPVTPTGSMILQQQKGVDVIFGKNSETNRSRGVRGQQWRKKSIFFELPYWEHSLLRHNLDVMHIEKNVFDNVISTILDDKGKSKDNLSARKDLQELGIRSELWPDENDKYLQASFKLRNSEKDTFLGILQNARLPDGYSSNISRCVDLRQRKIHGLKSHDCHVIMGHLLPIAIRGVLSPDVTSVITELCHFFKEICSKVIDFSELINLQKRIVLTLCHLEMLFPPSFFTVMMHLTVHLTEEVKYGGPVHFRWMYPVERSLGRFKSYVRNRAQPEGSICQQYLAEECLTFCSMYLDGIETRFNRIGRVNDIPMSTHDHSLGADSQIPILFPSLGRCNGASQYVTLSPTEKQQAHRYILISCPFLDGLREKFKDELRRTNSRGRRRRYTLDIDREVHLRFDKWLRQKVERNEIMDISDDIRHIAKGPSDKVLKFSSYNINGFKYRTLERDSDLKTQNCGVFISAETMSYASSRDNNPRAGNVPYYGKLVDIIQLNYYEKFRVVLFKCKWADTRDNRGYKKDGLGNNLVNFSRTIHSGEGEEDEPFVLASQAGMVYYIEDPSESGWNVGVHVQPRDLYDMGDFDLSDGPIEDIDISGALVNNSLVLSDDIPNYQLARDNMDDNDVELVDGL